MRRIRVSKVVPLILCTFFTIAPASAVTPNRTLLSMIPPMAHSVAGMSAASRGDQPDSFLLITHNNQMDLNDFMALSGADSSRFIGEIIMVASDGGDSLAEHSLLASGQFDRELIYRSAYRSGAGAKALEYRGIAALEVQPFTRERVNFRDVRWLAMMDGKLAVFGTPRLVQQELDRYLDHSVADPVLEKRLAHLRRDDATWCVVTMPGHNGEIQAMFQLVDSRLAGVLRAGDTLQFGIHYGRKVEFEYEVGMPSIGDPQAYQRSLEQSATQSKESALLPPADLSQVDGGVRGVLKLSKDRYEAWLAEVQASGRLRTVAGSRGD